ncbi:unnamed protein product [Rhizophagus irregularis]|nr:unnamed protein product [Rhizophagus irregularis]
MAESCRMYQHHTLYKRCIPKFLHPFPGQYRNDGDIFWNCFHQALEANKKGYDGKRRILSIIAEKFSYNILMEKLKIAQGTIFEAKKYARINGLGCVVIEKPIRKVKRITSEQKQQFDSFSQDKAHVIMSSYKTDAKTGQPVVYLKNTKNLLWEKFKENFPNGIKRTTFYTQLMGRQYIYREDLGGLCSTCSTYGYETFEEIINLIKEKINDVELQYRNDGDIFWNCFHQALEANKKGYDGKRRILSIIAEKFSYNILMEKLKIAQGTIFEAKKYARINGLGCVVIEKPIRKVKRITSEQKQQFDSFSQDKAHVIMSSYKTDAKTGQPVVYLKNTKNLLWEKFKENFPNGIKRTTFYTQLMGRQYIYREDLGGLCSTCSTYGYETFEEIINLIKEKINDVELQVKIKFIMKVLIYSLLINVLNGVNFA